MTPVRGTGLRWRASQDGWARFFGGGGEEVIDGDLDEKGANDVGASFEQDGDEGDGGLELVGDEVADETPHEAAIVDLADDVVVGGVGLGGGLGFGGRGDGGSGGGVWVRRRGGVRAGGRGRGWVCGRGRGGRTTVRRGEFWVCAGLRHDFIVER